MQENQIKALIKLISEESGDDLHQLKAELAGVIKHNPAVFKNVLRTDYKDGMPSFVHSLLEDVAWDRLKDSFAAFAAKINPDLEEALELLSKFHNPILKPSAFHNKIDSTAADLRPLILNCADTLDVAQMMQVLFFKTLNFKTVTANLRPEHLSFERAIDTGYYSGLMMAALYAVCGQRYGIDINIVDLAGRIMIQFTDPAFTDPFYADPFDQGKVLTLKECMEFTAARSVEWNDEFLKPLSTRAFTRRALANMVYVNNKLKDARRLKYLRQYLSVMEV